MKQARNRYFILYCYFTKLIRQCLVSMRYPLQRRCASWTQLGHSGTFYDWSNKIIWSQSSPEQDLNEFTRKYNKIKYSHSNHYSHNIPYLDSNGATLCLTFAIRNGTIPQSPITNTDTINNMVYIYYYNGCNDDKGNWVMTEDILPWLHVFLSEVPGFFLRFRMTKYNTSRTEHGFTTNFRKSHVPIFFFR